MAVVASWWSCGDVGGKMMTGGGGARAFCCLHALWASCVRVEIGVYFISLW